jgi:hypothetical protein
MIKLFWRFLRESEKTRAKCPGIDSGSPRVLNQNGQKNEFFKSKWAKKPSLSSQNGRKKQIKHEFCLSDDQKACSKLFTEIVSRGIR